jgi:hypothetical protein
MSVLPLTFEDKVDSPELVAWLATFGAEKKLTAAEINLIRDAINELKQSFDDIDFPDTSSFATTTQLTDGLATKAPTIHTHTIAQITGLETALNAKENTENKTDVQADFTSTTKFWSIKGVVDYFTSRWVAASL